MVTPADTERLQMHPSMQMRPARYLKRRASLCTGSLPEPLSSAGCRLRKITAGSTHSPVHWVFIWVSHQDLGKSLVDGDPFPCGTGRHVDERQDVQLILIWSRETCQLVGHATLFRLEPGPRVMRDQPNNAWRRTQTLEPVRAVHRVETRGGNGLRIPDVVKPGRHDDSLGDVKAPCHEVLGGPSDGLHMKPTVAHLMKA